jgi:hypothetical protein
MLAVVIAILQGAPVRQELSLARRVYSDCAVGNSIATEAARGKKPKMACLDQNGRAFPGYSQFHL